MHSDNDRGNRAVRVNQISLDHLAINAEEETERITTFIKETLVSDLRRRGAVIALSGGIDSSVTAALCVKALGPERVIGLLMPERHSSSDTTRLGLLIASALNIKALKHDITPVLEATGCYERQNEAIQSLIPQYMPGDQFKIVLPAQNSVQYRIFSLIVKRADGTTYKKRMTHEAYLQLVAATNFKQRSRKMIEYYYADRYNYAVVGSPNRLEFDQGFFVKAGDGSADLKPIAHLYKTQVYALAAYLGVPEEIRWRPPTTDTYPMEQSQEEFYFSLPYDKMDLCLYARNNGLCPESVCSATGLTPAQARTVFTDIDTKRKTTRYQHRHPLLVQTIPDIT